MGNDFFFEGHAVTLAKSIANSTSPLGGDARSIDQCPTDAQITTMETLNGQPASVVATVTVLASATFPLKNSTPGKAHADRSAVKLCFVHPSKFPILRFNPRAGTTIGAPDAQSAAARDQKKSREIGRRMTTTRSSLGVACCIAGTLLAAISANAGDQQAAERRSPTNGATGRSLRSTIRIIGSRSAVAERVRSR